MLNNREKKIINLLIEDKYLDIEQLSKKFNVSTRTIKRDFENINTFINRFDLRILNRKGRGYKINYNKENINKLILFINKQEPLTIEKEIFLDLIDKSLTYYDLQCKYLYSESTIKNKITSIKGLIDKYDLKVKYNPYKGLKIIGKEENIRKYLYDNYFIYIDNILMFTKLPNVDEKYIKKISNVLNTILKENEIILTDTDYSNLISLLIISIYRQNYSINNDKFNMYNDVVKKIVYKLNVNLNTEIGLSEISYISQKSIFGNLNDSITERVDNVIKKSIIRIKKYSQNYYEFGERFRYAIKNHIDLLIKRGIKKILVPNSLLDEIKQKYIIEYSDALIISQEIYDEFNIDVSEDEIGYLAIHLGSSKKIAKESKNVVLICNYGIGISQIIKIKLETENNDLNVIGVYPVAYLADAMKLNPDLVISTVNLTNYNYEVPLIESDELLLNGKIKNLGKYFKPELKMLLNKELFFDLNVKSKDDFFNKAKKILIGNDIIDEKIFELILEREKSFSTDFIEFVAIPHIIHRSKYKSNIIIFRLENKVKWSRYKVSLVFIILINENEKKYVETLNGLYEYILDDNNLNKMLQAKNSTEFIEDILA